MTLVNDVEVSAIRPAGFKCFDDIRPVLLAARLGCEHRRRLLEPVGKVGLEPVSTLGADPQIATGLAIDPARKIDPLRNLGRALAIPWQVLTQMAIRLGAVIAEAA